jgi:hypothetical protein
MSLEIEVVPDDKRPYHIKKKNFRTYFNVAEVFKWCEENFGHRNDKYDNPRWYGNTQWMSGDFKFKRRKDAVWFIMRWS